MTLRPCLQAKLLGWLTSSFTKAPSLLPLLWCSHEVPTDLHHIQVQVVPTCSADWTQTCFQHLFQGPEPACWLSRKDKCRSRLGSQILEAAAEETKVLFCSLGKHFDPPSVAKGPLRSWPCIKESGSHECIQHTLQMPL